MPLQALLFDFDGLILDTETPSFGSWQRLYREHGQELTLERWSAAVGTLDGFDPVAHLRELVGPVELDESLARRAAHELALVEVEQLRPGVLEYLEEARRRGIETAIVSSGSRRWIAGHLARLERAEHFTTIVTADGDTRRAKPLPVLYLEALDRLAIGAADAVAFEDSTNGVRAAKAAGLFCVAVPNSVTASFVLDEADIVVPSLAELPFERLVELAAAAG